MFIRLSTAFVMLLGLTALVSARAPIPRGTDELEEPLPRRTDRPEA